jgi:RNA polymerase sigma factor (sigma-70 family)
LFGIAGNLRWNLFSARNRRREVGLEGDEQTRCSPGQSLGSIQAPDEALRRHELEEAINKCIVQLSEPEREVFLLHQQGLTNDEIRELLEITYQIVGNRLHDARQRIRACLERRGLL